MESQNYWVLRILAISAASDNSRVENVCLDFISDLTSIRLSILATQYITSASLISR